MTPPFKPGDRVLYVPMHARGDRTHPDCERGTVSSIGRANNVFVRFDEFVARHGWEGATSQLCKVEDLILESEL